jgi:hypothetical protein
VLVFQTRAKEFDGNLRKEIRYKKCRVVRAYKRLLAIQQRTSAEISAKKNT